MASLAARTREAVRARPFLYDALRAGVVNYTAAARWLSVEGDTEAVATALRRYAEELDGDAGPESDARVAMRSGLGRADDEDALIAVADAAYAPDSGSLTGIVVAGLTGVDTFERVLGALRAAGIGVDAAGFAAETALVVVGRRDGPDAVRAVEAALEA
ncbi:MULTISPECIES: DUF7523 family protein [Halomicrobium]|uniref:ACT domain-containing protein n=2 Tax=Halomicrobium mukohataei TaxID=57705 RepID=C7NWT3_HALMD|nr:MULTISPECIES: hypothetical protein [Halomicrobium]ACV48293.1 conserved hypothetical protein [Halomicrobium mukohataei DSM 12286]QCD66710.1 hypothetical protein E5139_14040 [Halomicrobium mukohataei]QFR21516.1 hypothetical protein GBQ70_14055 [Halomicrobium sp. ZPS1]